MSAAVKILKVPDFKTMSRKQLREAQEVTHVASVKIRTQAAVNVMKRAKRPTGWLASHIAAYTSKVGHQIIGVIQVNNTPYDKYIEYGDKKRKFKGYHYLTDAYDKGRKWWINELNKIF